MFRPATALIAAACIAAPASAQMQRNFPQNAMRGGVVVGEAPLIALNGIAAQLAPGARIRDANNLLVVPSSLAGGRFLVNYTVDLLGLVKDVWILTPAEAAMFPWPTSVDQLQAWRFDPVAQTWTKP